jgi:hypothetical protein
MSRPKKADGENSFSPHCLEETPDHPWRRISWPACQPSLSRVVLIVVAIGRLLCRSHARTKFSPPRLPLLRIGGTFRGIAEFAWLP